MNRWAKAGVFDCVFEEMLRQQLIRIKIEAVSVDSTSVKVHPDGMGALKKTDHKPLASPVADGTQKFIWLPRMPGTAVTFSLSSGQAHDAPAGRELLRTLDGLPQGCRVVMDRAYEGNETRQLVLDLGFEPVVPPLSTRVNSWT